MATRSTLLRMAATTLLAVAVFLPIVLVGCTGDGPGGTASTGTGDPSGTAVDRYQVAMSDTARLAPAASQSNILSAAGSMQAFGVDLYEILATDAGDGNLVFSPSSIVTALAMTYAGAAGTTAQEMAATLHFDLEGDALHQAFNSLDTMLESRSLDQADGEDDVEGVLVKIANSLWAQQDLAFEKPFLDTLAANYGAGVRLRDFASAAEEAREAINSWVAGETNDKIPELLAPGVINAMTRLVLVNAVYLDATWAMQFDPNLTRKGDFTTLSGDPVDADMMWQQEEFPFATGDGWKAVELPYLGNQLAMLIFVPDQGRFAEFEGALALGVIDRVIGALEEGAEVALTMPKFEFRTQAGLNETLKALGMKTAFDAGAADFSGMTTQTALFISAVIHEAFIAVDEKGTEAAAATAVAMDEGAYMPENLVKLTIDRPFLFALRDRETGAILFLGRVTDPTL